MFLFLFIYLFIFLLNFKNDISALLFIISAPILSLLSIRKIPHMRKVESLSAEIAIIILIIRLVVKFVHVHTCIRDHYKKLKNLASNLIGI